MNELNNTRIKILKEKPCHIFKIENFFSDKFYEELRLSFPKIYNFNSLLDNSNSKFSINSENKEHYDKYLKNNQSFFKIKKNSRFKRIF